MCLSRCLVFLETYGSASANDSSNRDSRQSLGRSAFTPCAEGKT